MDGKIHPRGGQLEQPASARCQPVGEEVAGDQHRAKEVIDTVVRLNHVVPGNAGVERFDDVFGQSASVERIRAARATIVDGVEHRIVRVVLRACVANLAEIEKAVQVEIAFEDVGFRRTASVIETWIVHGRGKRLLPVLGPGEKLQR